MAYTLVIGNKNTSTWSLRPWIAMKSAGIVFEEAKVDLRATDAKLQILGHSPSGKVPALKCDGEVIWDSLAILEFLAETHPEATLWPQERIARARARAVSCEMHAGFQALRQECPMDFNARGLAPADAGAIEADVARICELWHAYRTNFTGMGPFLFGAFSAADAMYAPVASRFATYGLAPKDETARAYVDAMMALPAMQDWAADAAREHSGAA